MLSLKLVVFLFLLNYVSGENILFLNGIASPSHHLWNQKLIRGLAQKGFNITMVSTDDDKKPQPNIHYIHLEKVYETIYGNDSSLILDMADQKSVEAIYGVYEWCEVNCDGILKSKGLEVIINYPDDFKFDAVIYDFTCGPCLLPLLHKFKYPPLISVTAFANPPYSFHIIGGNKYPAYVPHFSTDFSQYMSYFERLFNTFIYAVDTYVRQYVVMSRMEKKVRERFEFKDYPALAKLEQKTALMLVNTDVAVDFSEPLQPNVIQVGGLQIVEAKPLPDKMLKFVESGKKGTILMSLGTNVKSNMLGEERLGSIIKTFAQLPDYNFIWKFESEENELPMKLPKNVFIAKFLPQNDILAHTNVKAFVTHAGGLSSHESLWYGVPMITIPFFCDQIRSASKLVNLGVAVKIDFRTLNLQNFKEAINTVLNDPSYSAKSKRTSELFQDKPMRPLDTAIWWIKYTIRNPSAPQFHSPALKLDWIVSNSYDVILTLLVAIHLLVYFVFKIVKIIKKSFEKPESKKLKRN